MHTRFVRWQHLSILFILLVAGGVWILSQLNRASQDVSAVIQSIAGGPSVTVDFSHQIATGSPLIFGGAHMPNIEHQDAWDLLQSAGVTSIRRDMYLEYMVPNTTIADYIANKNNVQDSSTWNMSGPKTIYENAQKRGMKVIAIVAYAPPWLTYTGKNFGVPRDWEVYKDIVTKAYKALRPSIDYIEIWNEPDWKTFLDTSGSGMTREEAYTNIYAAAASAIRAVDVQAGDGKKIPIGGPVLADPSQTQFIDALFTDPRTRDLVDFVSYHAYAGNDKFRAKVVQTMEKYGKANLPLYISEWNRDGDAKRNANYNNTDIATSYTGTRFIEFLSRGTGMASYFATTILDPKSNLETQRVWGFYTMVNGKVSLLPQAKTWRLLSRTLGLGMGSSTVYESSTNADVVSTAVVNSKGQRAVIVSNEGKALDIAVRATHLENTKKDPWGIATKVSQMIDTLLGAKVTVTVYEASSTHDGATPLCIQTVDATGGTSQFRLPVSAQSVLGLTIDHAGLSLERVTQVFGTKPTTGCLSAQ